METHLHDLETNSIFKSRNFALLIQINIINAEINSIQK